jgi:hypothetical protein
MRIHVAARLFTALWLFCAGGWAQSFYGSIVGSVRDQTGAIIDSAKVDAVNLGTSERRSATTDANGNYQFVNLVPGRYRVEVEKVGFRRFMREPVVVEVQAAVRIDVGLEVGDVSQSVEVQAETPLLQTENASLGQIVESRKVLETPLNGRNVLNLVALVPGVVPQGQAMGNPTGANPFAWGNYQIGGGMANQSATMIDGAPVNVTYINLTALVPTQDAIQEFRVQTNSLGAEFGRFAGGVINLTTKSGTNEFHGSAYEFLRNRVLNANTFFNNRGGVDRPAFTQNQYGANIGGPVKRDRLFIFYGFEGFRVRQGQSYIATVPTEAMRSGDFSDLRDASGNVVPIYDTLTTCGRFGNPACGVDAAGREIIQRTPFASNIIPNARIDQAARQMNGTWALPNGPGQPFTRVNNYTANASVGGNNDQHNARADYNLSERQRLFVRYTNWKNTNLPIDPYNTQTCLDRCTEIFTTHQAVVADTYSLSPTTILDVRLAYLRFVYDRIPLTAGFDLTQLGWPSALNSQVLMRVQPTANVQGYHDLPTSQGTGSVIIDRNDSYSIVPTLTKIWGRHTIKAGMEVRRLTHNYAQTNVPSGTFSFDRLMTTSNPFAPSGGNGFASYLLGFGTGGSLGNPALVAGQQIYRGYYLNDSFQLTRNITLSLGFRFDQMGPWSERFDRLTVLLTGADSLASRPGRLGLVNSDDRRSRTNQNLGNLPAPRAGLAWRLGDKTVLRAGYGVFWLPNDVIFVLAPNLDLVNSINTPFVGTIDGSLTPQDRLSNPFPNGILIPPGRRPEYQQILLGQGIRAPIQDDNYGYNQQWNFSIQRELPGGISADVAYAGAKGSHIPGYTTQINQLPEEFMSMGTALQQQVPNPFLGLITTGSLAAPTVSRGQLLRPFPHHTGVEIAANGNRNSTYQSMQVKVEKRFGSGGSILGAYTWAKLIADTDTGTGWLESGGGFGAQNWRNLQLERAPSLNDVPHRAVISYVYDLPFGKGQPLAGGVTGVVAKLVSGWGINGVSTFQSGFPLGLSTAVNLTNSFGGGSRPNWTGQSARLDGPAQQRLSRWFDTTQFSQPAAFNFGNTARVLSNIRAHGINNFDFAIFKNTQLVRERVGLQFRTEIFNLFNRVQFGFPGRAFGNPQFGVVSGQANQPRLVQFALRVIF